MTNVSVHYFSLEGVVSLVEETVYACLITQFQSIRGSVPFFPSPPHIFCFVLDPLNLDMTVPVDSLS